MRTILVRALHSLTPTASRVFLYHSFHLDLHFFLTLSRQHAALPVPRFWFLASHITAFRTPGPAAPTPNREPPHNRSAPAYVYNFVYRAAQSNGQALHASDLPFFFGDSGEFDIPGQFTGREVWSLGFSRSLYLLSFTIFPCYNPVAPVFCHFVAPLPKIYQTATRYWFLLIRLRTLQYCSSESLSLCLGWSCAWPYACGLGCA